MCVCWMGTTPHPPVWLLASEPLCYLGILLLLYPGSATYSNRVMHACGHNSFPVCSVPVQVATRTRREMDRCAMTWVATMRDAMNGPWEKRKRCLHLAFLVLEFMVLHAEAVSRETSHRRIIPIAVLPLGSMLYGAPRHRRHKLLSSQKNSVN